MSTALSSWTQQPARAPARTGAIAALAGDKISLGSTQSSSSSGQQSRDPQSRQLLPANSKPSLTGSMTGLPSDTTSQSVLAQSPQGQGGTAVNGTANGKPGLCQAPISTAGSVPERRELETLRTEVKMLRKELAKSKEMISKLQDREKMLRDRLSEQAQKQLEKSAKFEDLSMGDSRPTALIRRYGNLYSQTRVDAFDALDMLPEMADFDDLKAKLLFSIVVLSFRSVKQKLSDMHGKFYHMLDVPQPEGREASSLDPVVQDLEETIGIYLRKNVDKFDVTALVEDVRTQLLATLYDYPSLKTCAGLHVYIEECVRLAWALSVQKPSYVIDYEAKIYDPHMHMRFHSSDPESLEIQNVLWPALLEGENGPCVQKGVVLT